MKPVPDLQTIIPANRPRLKRPELIAKLNQRGIALPADRPLVIVARGYFLNSMGKPGANDTDLYDDALFYLFGDEYATFNASCDPATTRHPDGAPTLQPGTYVYQIGFHRLPQNLRKFPQAKWNFSQRIRAESHVALVQAKPVTILRTNGKTYTGFFGINIHGGGIKKTGSEGCITLPPAQWKLFIERCCAAFGKSRYGFTEDESMNNTFVNLLIFDWHE